MGGVTRRRFIQTTAATGAAATLLPAGRARAQRTVPAPADVGARTRAYLEEQRKAGVRAGGDPAFLTGTQLAAMLAARDISSREVTQAFLTRINALNGDGGYSVPSRPVTGTTPNPDIPVYGDNGKLNAYVRVYDDLAMSMARDADALGWTRAGRRWAAACRSRSRTSSRSPGTG